MKYTRLHYNKCSGCGRTDLPCREFVMGSNNLYYFCQNCIGEVLQDILSTNPFNERILDILNWNRNFVKSRRE